MRLEQAEWLPEQRRLQHLAKLVVAPRIPLVTPRIPLVAPGIPLVALSIPLVALRTPLVALRTPLVTGAAAAATLVGFLPKRLYLEEVAGV